MSLLDDLREDLIADALAAPAAKRPRNDWVEKTTWTLTGYVARCTSLYCPRCKKTYEAGGGVYAEEAGSNGTRRLTRAVQFVPKQNCRMELVTEELDGFCFNCLVDQGFTEVEEAPQVPTNIAGEGIFTPPKLRSTLGFIRPSYERSEGGKLLTTPHFSNRSREDQTSHELPVAIVPA